MGNSRKNPNERVEDTLFWNTWNFSFSYFTPGNSRQNKAQPLDISQNCVRSLGNSRAKSKDPWKFHIIYSWSPLEIPLYFLLTPRNCACYFFDMPGNSISSTPPSCLNFFSNSPFHFLSSIFRNLTINWGKICFQIG